MQLLRHLPLRQRHDESKSLFGNKTHARYGGTTLDHHTACQRFEQHGKEWNGRLLITKYAVVNRIAKPPGESQTRLSHAVRHTASAHKMD